MTKQSLNLNLVGGSCVVLLFLFFSFVPFSPLEPLERALYDVETSLLISHHKDPQRIVLIEIDDKSIDRLGAWPWPRSFIAGLVQILTEGGAKLIGLHLPFVEEERNGALEKVRDFRQRMRDSEVGQGNKTMITSVQENLLRLEEAIDHDKQLVESVEGSGRVILPVLSQLPHGQSKPSSVDEGLLSESFLMEKNVDPSLKEELSVPSLYPPYPSLARASLGLGHGGPVHEAATGRAYPMFVTYKGSLVPSFALRVAIAALDKRPGQVLVEGNSVRLGDRSIPLMNGKMLIKFDKGQRDLPRYSFVDVARAKSLPPVIKGRIGLVGLTFGGSGTVVTPFSRTTSQVTFLGYVLDSILNKRFFLRPSFMPYVEGGAILLLGALAVVIFPGMGQLTRLGWMTGMAVLCLLSGFLVMVFSDVWVKTATIALSVAGIYVVVTGIHVSFTERATRESMESNRLLGLSFQSQGLFDLAFDKFRKLPLDLETKDLIYNLGLEYEQKRAGNKALAVYEYINKGGGFRDLDERIVRLKESDKSSTLGSHNQVRQPSFIEDLEEEEITSVGRYKILETLGRGSMGLVYKALDPKINRLLAIKTIRFSDEFDEDVIQEIKDRFFREAEIAGQLSHPSIVTIYDLGDDRDLTYMAMEYLEGEDLEKFIARNNLLPLQKVLHVVAGVADALDFAHKADVIHRDIKPANIMLLKSGGIKVTDFGIAKAISSSRTKTGVILGTPNYMSPEQIMGQKIDSRSDIFSLGVLFFQLLTGQLPFQGDNLSSLLYQITQVRHPQLGHYNAKIPRACEQIMDKALAKNPNERFQSAAEFARFLRMLASKIDEMRRKKAGQRRMAVGV
jgi:CHASE2 domain-containing sensor protein/tRNA A-37 threonylcarbamoyl transferase component Bud32